MDIAPSVLTADLSRLADVTEVAIQAGINWIHLDIMDGHFVPNMTIGPPVIRCLRDAVGKTPYFDAHLMINNAEEMYLDYIRSGVNHITVHIEATTHLHRCVQAIRSEGVSVGVSLNPGTPIESVLPVLNEIDLVLIMSVNPGFGGQKFIPESLHRISKIREMIKSQVIKGGKKVQIQIDGGVNIETIREVFQTGADCAVIGSALYNNNSFSDNLQNLKNEMER
tara:strand:- start:225 stop:896 length:672 start_codon:yes stop_codon:yes gene_type:complete